MELRDFLVFLSTTGAAVAAWWLMEQLWFLARLEPPAKRYAAFGLTAAIAVVAWLAQVAMLYAPAPEGWRSWVESLSAVAFTAVGLNQILHAAVTMGRNKPLPSPPPADSSWPRSAHSGGG